MRKFAAVLASSAALALAAPTAGAAAPPAHTAAANFVVIITKGKLKAGKSFGFQIGCTADCSVTVRGKIKLPGRDIKLPPIGAPIPANFAREARFTLTGTFKAKLIANVHKAKLKGSVTGIKSATGERQVVPFHFKFKR